LIKFFQLKTKLLKTVTRFLYNQEIVRMKRILLIAVVLIVSVTSASASGQVSQFIKKGHVLSWSASSGNFGSMKVVFVDGLLFEVEQSNQVNKAAGIIRLYGAIVNNGKKAVLLNVGPWKEVWEGTVSGNKIVGTLVAGRSVYTFKIRAEGHAEVSTKPFIAGKTLSWQTDAAGGQDGTIYVVSTRGTTFKLEQRNNQNKSAGVTKLDGEFKDGKIYIYNKKWHETWTGTFNKGAVNGKINNRYTFRIF
jgi:hypothetical protein